MSSESPPADRRLNRSLMKNEQLLIEACRMPNPEEKDQIQDNVLCCEITTLGEKNKVNKKNLLPFSKQEHLTKNMPRIHSQAENHSKTAPVRKPTNDKSCTEGLQNIGLKDLGANSNISNRSGASGRLLPHIGHKHLQKETSAVLLRSSNLGGSKTASPSLKINTSLIKTTLKTNELGDLPKEANDVTMTQSSLSCLSQTNSYENTGCLLNPNTLHPLMGTKHKPAPPARKMSSAKAQLSSPASSNPNKLHNAAGKQMITSGSAPGTKSDADKSLPGSIVKPIISVRKLELNQDKLMRSNRPLSSHAELQTGSERSLPSRERSLRTRSSHPPPTSAKKSGIVTIAKQAKNF